MFNRGMTDIAIADEIAHLVGILIVGEIAKATDMVNVQMFSKLFFGDAAALASVAVTSTGGTSLLPPVRAIVRLMTAFPCGAIFALRAMHYQPIAMTTLAAEATASSLGRRLKVLAALLTGGRIDRRFPMGDIIYRIFGGTGAGTVFTRPTLEILKDFSAGGACGCGLFAHIVQRIAALIRAGFYRPRLMVGDFLAANGAVDCDVVFGLS
jgi:hypothetical protein